MKGDFAPFHRKIGISLELTGQTAEAERAYRRCLQLDPRDMHTHQDLAIMIAIKGVRLMLLLLPLPLSPPPRNSRRHATRRARTLI